MKSVRSMRIMITLCVAAALGLVLLFAGCGDKSGKSDPQASLSTGTAGVVELSLQEFPESAVTPART